MVTQIVTNLLDNLDQHKEEQEKLKAFPDKVTVNAMVSKVAFFYERIRNTLEYGDEHLVRKNAIKRIIKRRLIENVTGNDISRFLINELIRGGYVEDNSVPEFKIHEVAQIINKYIVFRNNIIDRYEEKMVIRLYEWTLALMACEIEESLASFAKENAYIEAFYRTVEKRIFIKDPKIISKRDFGLQLYIATLRLLVKSDRELLSYRLFKMHYPQWKEPDKDFVVKIARQSQKIYEIIHKQIDHPMGKFLIKNLRPYAIKFNILKDTVSDYEGDFRQLMNNREDFNGEVKKVCNSQYKKIRGKLRRSVFRGIVYIFVTKMILALILEMPADLYFFGHIEYIPLYINVVFPPILLFLITMFARVPSQANTTKIIEGIDEYVYGDNHDKVICEIKKSYTRSGILDNIFKGFYFVTFVISYGAIVYGLYILKFNVISGGLFLLFLSLVSYFGIRIRRLSKELVVVARKENLLTFLLDIFSYPIIRVGQWISDKTAKVNVFIFILDVIIEAPFKTLLEVFDQWSNFIKEKREELY